MFQKDLVVKTEVTSSGRKKAKARLASSFVNCVYLKIYIRKKEISVPSFDFSNCSSHPLRNSDKNVREFALTPTLPRHGACWYQTKPYAGSSCWNILQ